ncbi:MAG: hypothetical protein GMKNLPBB_01802 [Myxococcota bacterium]|nr:hypothetical protein [Myxococcota bacterium]
MKTWVIGILVCAVSLVSSAAHARDELQKLEGDSSKYRFVVDRKHPGDRHHELAPFFLLHMNSNFSRSNAFVLEYLYHLNHWFSFGLDAGYALGGETSLTREVRGKSSPSNLFFHPRETDRRYTTWIAHPVLQFRPVYGKFSLFAEHDLNWEFLFDVGGGAQGIKTDGTPEASPQLPAVNKVAFGYNVGVGFRFYLAKFMSLRLQLKDIAYFDSGLFNQKPAADRGDDEKDQPEKNSTVTNNFFLMMGLGFLF